MSITTLITVLICVSIAPSVVSINVRELFFNKWPSHCCRLELREMKYGDELPQDYVYGGIGGPENLQNLSYVFDRVKHRILFKPESYKSTPIDPSDNCKGVTESGLFDVLVNPNKCALEWYTLRYPKEEFPLISGHLLNGGRYFAPAYDGWYFAQFKEQDRFYAGAKKDEVVHGCRLNSESNADYVVNSYAGNRVLIVDCLKSLTTMADTTLYNISFPGDLMPRKSNVTYFHRTYKNDSPSPQKQKVGFSVERKNSVEVSLSEYYSSTRCDENSESFSKTFESSLSAGIGVSFFIFSFQISASIRNAITTTTTTASQVCLAQGRNRSSTTIQEETKRYAFDDEITVPANSITVVDAFSTPIQTDIDYTMTFRIRPRVGDRTQIHDIIREGIDYFKLSDRSYSNGTNVLVDFNGKISIDSGYEVTVDVLSTPLNGSDNYQVQPLASYNLIPEQN